MDRKQLSMCVLKYIYFLAVLCKTTTWNHRNLRRLRTETAENIYFPFGSQRCLHMYTYVLLRLRCGAVKDGKPMQPFSKIIIKNINSFLNGHRPWRCHPICLRTQISIFFIGYLSISRLSQSYEICKQSSIILIERSACSIINEVTGK